MSRRTTAALAALVIACAAGVETAVAKEEISYRREITALYVIDHWGWKPRNDAELAVYNREFNKIMRSCRIGSTLLTNNMLFLADKASDLGQRDVTALMMMKAVTRRITWSGKANCARTFHVAEGYMEAGGP